MVDGFVVVDRERGLSRDQSVGMEERESVDHRSVVLETIRERGLAKVGSVVLLGQR